MDNIKDLLPKSFDDITVETYQELLTLNVNDFEGEFSLLTEQLAILLGVGSDDELFDDLDIDDLIDAMNNIKWLKSNPTYNYKKDVEYLTCKSDLNKLTLGEFIDLEYFFEQDYIKNLHIICGILYKQYKTDDWNNTIEEPYIYDIYERSNLFIEQPISNVYGIIKMYLDWKENILNAYANLFEDPNFDKIEDEHMFEPEELMEMKQEIEVEKKKSKWSWEAIIWELSGKNLSYYDQVLNIPIILVFNTLSMKKTLEI